MTTNFQDVQAFHQKFGLQRPILPVFPSPELAGFRIGFMQEELDEFKQALDEGDLPKAMDAMIDLVYVAMGTADLMGCPWQLLWQEVQTANMAKERAKRAEDSTRGSTFDVVKPAGWTPPNIHGVLLRYMQQVLESTPSTAIHHCRREHGLRTWTPDGLVG